MTLDECLEKHGIAAPRCGAECGDGWIPIVDAFFTLAGNKEYTVAQVKEKFGTLRIYLDQPYDTQVQALVKCAEAASSHTCELCGGPGALRGGGWVRTLCDGCAVLR